MKTKKLLLLIILPVIIGQGAKGQGYIPLVDTGKIWSTAFELIDWIDTYWTKFTADTIIYGKLYKKVITAYDSTFQYNQISGYIREDSIGKVFFMNTLLEEGLIYDFGSNVGDTLLIYNRVGYPSKLSDCYEETIVVVDSVYFSKDITIYSCYDNFDPSYLVPLLDDNYRKVIVIKKINTEHFDKWIEGIGSISGVLESSSRFFCDLFCYSFLQNTLLCYKEKTNFIYQDFYYYYPTCHISVSNINEFSNFSFQVYPNPILNNCFTISFTEKFEGNIVLYNLLGTPVLIEKIANPITQTIICLSEFETGVYLLKIESLDSIFYRKIIK